MERDIILNGIHIGEHELVPEKLIEEIRERCIKPGLNFVTIRPTRAYVPPHYFVEWAKFLAENKIYFCFLYTVQYLPDDQDSMLDEETVNQIKEIAGEYFIGDMLGEMGTSGSCVAAGYYRKTRHKKDARRLRFDLNDMAEAHESFVNNVSKDVASDKKIGIHDILSVEATGLNKYNIQAGITFPMLELMCGSPDVLVSSLRGTARGMGLKKWGTYVAHEWYGGMRHEDTLKRKRLELGYKYAYLAGSHALCVESGDESIDSFGHSYSGDSELCEDYREILTKMIDYIKSDARPSGGPQVKVALVSGLHDSWGGWGGSSAWNQFHREEWGHNEAEHSWRMAYEIGVKRSWTDVANYGDHDFSPFPAYGMYDIVPIEAPADNLFRYDYLIFLGWNSMTDENMDKLIAYVEQGGKLLMSAAHLNHQTKRDGEFIMPDPSKLKKLFGLRFNGNFIRTNDGVKFNYTSLNDQLMYPGSKSLACDPLFAAGYVTYADFELCGGREAAFISDSFADDSHILPAVIENKLGNGVATLVASTNYPGNPALYPLYRSIFREIVTASARCCDIQVIASDRLRYAVYPGNKIYLLNTDYDLPITVKILHKGQEQTITLNSLELKAIQL